MPDLPAVVADREISSRAAPWAPTTAEDDFLATARWGTLFLRPETESAYGVWRVEQAVPFNRAGMWASIAAWLTGLATLVVTGASGIWVAKVAALVLPPIVGALMTTYRRSLVRFMPITTMIANAAAGLVIVGVTNARLPIEARLATVLLNIYFGFAIFRLRPGQAALAVAPYVLLEAGVLSGAQNPATLAFGILLMSIAYSSGLMISVVLDIVSRSSFRQERIIEAQKESIARERARSEALLRQELHHQVAERSRELGEVLARVEAPQIPTRNFSAGERFDARYRIVRSLGAGGMGRVYEVERMTDGQQLALKVVSGSVSGAQAARFAREAEIGARVLHPNLVSIVDVGVARDGAPFLVMELVRGGSLEDRRSEFGSAAWALPVLRQVAEGLAALHEEGVVHRDLKPANILLSGDSDGEPLAKISDFGISRFGVMDDGMVNPDAATVSDGPNGRARALTGTGALLGTPLYMAPEAALGGRAVEAPADVFAFGLVSHELLAGSSPFAGPPVVLAMTQRPLPRAAALDERIDSMVRETILSCLAEAPGDRPGMRAVLDVLSGRAARSK